jgi:flagellar hook-basal body complex protein FliE
MSSVSGPLGLSGVLALRASILEKNRALATLADTTAAGRAQAAGAPDPAAGFARALEAVNRLQGESEAKTTAYERGETHDIAEVMLSRQKASIAFEAALQARNRLLGAYRDIMNMPV